MNRVYYLLVVAVSVAGATVSMINHCETGSSAEKVRKLGSVELTQSGSFDVALAPNGLYCIVFDRHSNELFRIDLASLDTAWKVPVENASESEPDYGAKVAVSPDGATCFVSIPSKKTIEVYDGTTGKHSLTATGKDRLYLPDKLSCDNENRFYFFQGEKGLDIVRLDLKTGKFDDVIDTKTILSMVPNSVRDLGYESRNFLVVDGNLLLGFWGIVSSFDLKQHVLNWSTVVSDKPRANIVTVRSDGRVFVDAGSQLIAQEISLETGEKLRSLADVAGDDFLIGANNSGQLIFWRQNGIRQPTHIGVFDWNGDSLGEVPMSPETALLAPKPKFCDNLGRNVVFLDRLNHLNFFQILDDNKNEPGK